jgi:hypothetical protein
MSFKVFRLSCFGDTFVNGKGFPMSIIFQLFSAEDLRQFTSTQLDELRDEILKALDEKNLRPLRNAEEAKENPGDPRKGKLELNLEEKIRLNETIFSGRPDDLKEAREALFRRFYEIAHQLKAPPYTSSNNPFEFDKLVRNLTDPENLSVEQKILRWAISCEINHIEFYYALVIAKEAAIKYIENTEPLKKKFQSAQSAGSQSDINAKPTIRIKNPDSVYSPFNPRHPLSGQYQKISRRISGA